MPVPQGAVLALAGAFRVPREPMAGHRHVPAPTWQEKPWQERGNQGLSIWPCVSLLLALICIFVSFEIPGQKSAEVLTRGHASKHEGPQLLASEAFCTEMLSTATKAPLEYKHQIRSTQTQQSLCLQIILQLETDHTVPLRFYLAHLNKQWPSHLSTNCSSSV